MKDKKGVSTIVATILVLMLTILAVAILAGFVIPFVKNQLERSTECFDFQNRYFFEDLDGLNCFSSEEDVLIAIGANGNKNVLDKVAGFDIILSGKGYGKTLEIRNGGVFPNLAMIGRTGLRVPEAGEFYSYNYSEGNRYLSAEIKTVLTSGRVCETVSDKIELGAC